jgi:hypothetical protein
VDSSANGALLHGFGRWLAKGEETSIGWPGQIERKVTGAKDWPGGESDMFRRLSDEQSRECIAALDEALRAFVAEHPS